MDYSIAGLPAQIKKRENPALSIEKVANGHFFEFFTDFASHIRSRAAKPAKCENLRFSSVLTHMSSKPELT